MWSNLNSWILHHLGFHILVMQLYGIPFFGGPWGYPSLCSSSSLVTSQEPLSWYLTLSAQTKHNTTLNNIHHLQTRCTPAKGRSLAKTPGTTSSCCFVWSYVNLCWRLKEGPSFTILAVSMERHLWQKDKCINVDQNVNIRTRPSLLGSRLQINQCCKYNINICHERGDIYKLWTPNYSRYDQRQKYMLGLRNEYVMSTRSYLDSPTLQRICVIHPLRS